jgi:energy-coupling factor transport system substrate-specific component
VGLLTDPIAAAFAPVAMVIGLVAGWLARAGWFRTLPKVVVSGVIITLAVTLVAVPIRTTLFGGVTGSGADLCRLDALGRSEPGGVRRDHRHRRESGR